MPADPEAKPSFELDVSEGLLGLDRGHILLERLERFRWLLIRIIAALVVGMVICLVATNWIVKVLTWPLAQADYISERFLRKSLPQGAGVVQVAYGTNAWNTTLPGDEFQPLATSTNQTAAFRLVPRLRGTNVVLGAEVIAPLKNRLHVDTQSKLVNLGPLEGFKVALGAAIYGGLTLASPLIFLFVGQFLQPLLGADLKKVLYPVVFAASGLFLAGVVFCYFVLLPVVMLACTQFSAWLGFEADQWRASDYISTVCNLLLGLGLGFELPIVVLLLVRIGILRSTIMRKFRSYFIVINLIISAFIMPPDGLTMFLMAIPIQILFEISIVLAQRLERRQAEAST
jgi:sec-independent protein translocase protein TatC